MIRNVLLFLLMIDLVTCERLTLPPRPAGVPDGSAFERRSRLWVERDGGKERTFYADGLLASEGELKAGLRSGVWTWYATDGRTITSRGNYADGRRHGLWNHQDDSGHPYVTITYATEPVDPVLSALSSDIGNENGDFERVYPDGKIELKGAYQAGRFHGRFQRFSKDGKILFEGVYKNGDREGLWSFYDSTGSLRRQESYTSGKLDGEFRLFQSGKPYFKTIYRSGAEVGPRQWSIP